MMGLNGEREALTVRDVATGVAHMYPTMTKTAGEVRMSLMHFAGKSTAERQIRLVYSDNAVEIGFACRQLKWLHDTSTPGVPQTNSLIERTNQTLVNQTISALDTAGLPPCFWSFAAPCVSMHYNINCLVDVSPWCKTTWAIIPREQNPFWR